ncbi:hypothetical protein H9W95_15230 [Flavobacterium lindanitolerans]|nr:hypothetical protein [Flavobacterium lindanitolerans]
MNFNSIAPTLQLSAFVKHIEVITSGASLQSESYLRFFRRLSGYSIQPIQSWLFYGFL